MSEKPLKAFLILGIDEKLSSEIKKLYNRNNCLIIGDGVKDISIADIKTELKAKNFVLDNTRIDICAHGIQNQKNKKQHSIWLKDQILTKTQDFFADLRKISDKPLNVHLWACHGSTANKDAISLGNGSSLTTHVESDYSSWNELADFSLQKSLKRYFDAKELTPEEQFIVDFPENFETMTFSKVENDNNIIKYKTTRFLKDDSIKDLVFFLKKNPQITLEEIVKDDIDFNKELFSKKLPKNIENIIKNTEIKLNNKQIQDYIGGRLIHAVQKEIINENEEVISELLNLLKNKGFVDLSYRINNIPLLHYAIENSEIFKQFIKNTDDVNISNGYGDTTLIRAVLSKNTESVKVLLSHPNVDVSKKDHDGKTSLDLAIEGSEKDIVKIFLENKKFSILDLKLENRKKALEVAMEYGFNVKPPIDPKPVLAPKPPEPKPHTIIPPKAKPRTTALIIPTAAVKPPIAPKPVIQDKPPVTKTRTDTDASPKPKPRTTIPSVAPNMITKPPIAPKPILTPKNVVTEAKPEPKPRLTPSAPKPKPRNPHGRG